MYLFNSQEKTTKPQEYDFEANGFSESWKLPKIKWLNWERIQIRIGLIVFLHKYIVGNVGIIPEDVETADINMSRTLPRTEINKKVAIEGIQEQIAKLNQDILDVQNELNQEKEKLPFKGLQKPKSYFSEN